ncbi:MAG: response regulator [Bacteroidia bacterium]|nr:response regulator [Bacteroidia bacterium]
MNNKVILCVDDEKMILTSLTAQLREKLGNKFLYETSENATEAMELIDELHEENKGIIVIVSDWLMPGIKGDEFLIRIHKKYPDIVKVMLTGQADKAAIENAQKHANLHACLTKPWSAEVLVNTIKSGLEKLAK